MIFSYGESNLNAERLLPLLSADAMREADRLAIDEWGVDGFTLMETAGRAVYASVRARLSGDASVVVFCGAGNNGGDGYVVARLLALSRYRVTVVRAGEPSMDSDAGRHVRLFDRSVSSLGRDRITQRSARAFLAHASPQSFDCCVDALLGTGVDRDLQGDITDLVRWMNGCNSPVISIDIPTGLHATTGRILGSAVRATETVTMGAVKTGMVFTDGPDVCGELTVAEIGISSTILAEQATRGDSGYLITDEAVRTWIPRRSRDAHKYSAGTVMVIAGSAGMSGAAVLAARAAARSGAGYVMCAAPESVATIVAGGVPTCTTIALPEAGDGLDADACLKRLEERLSRADALVVGPGLGRAPSTVAFVQRLLEGWDGPAVVDADAIIALAETDLGRFDGRSNWIITPHAGEYQRLASMSPEGIDRLESVRAFADSNQTTLLLKGAPSLIGSPSGEILIASVTSESLATAGTGDVLSGMCAAFLARGLRPPQAAACALHVGARAAGSFGRGFAPSSMIASDIIEGVPSAINDIFQAT